MLLHGVLAAIHNAHNDTHILACIIKAVLEKEEVLHADYMYYYYYVYATSFWRRSSLALHSEEALLRESKSWFLEGSWASKDR